MGHATQKPVAKQGKHGTLYRYEITYRDVCPDNGELFRATWRTWAYDSSHAVERFYDSSSDGEADGFDIVGAPRRVTS